MGSDAEVKLYLRTGDGRQIEATPAVLIEEGFARAYAKQQCYHLRWREVMVALQRLRGGEEIPHDAGDNDVYIDLLLRQLEDEQLECIKRTGRPYPHGRTRFQVQLTRYWLVGVGETLRVTRNAMLTDHPDRKKVSDLVDLFGAFRMMISKQEPQGLKRKSVAELIPKAFFAPSGKNDGMMDLNEISANYPGSGKYRIAPAFKAEAGAVAFPVYDAKSDKIQDSDRRALSDHVLQSFDA